MIMEKKNIGSVFALYPTPAGVVGTIDDNEKLNWMLMGHLGIITHKLLSVSLHHTHLSTETAIKTKRLSLNLVNDTMLQRADYVGIVSGKRVDKSQLFPWHKGEGGTPIIDEADLTMELEVVDDYEAEGFHNLICKITNTYINPDMIDEKGKIDYTKLKPILFEMPTYKYLRTGEIVGDCLKLGKELKETLNNE